MNQTNIDVLKEAMKTQHVVTINRQDFEVSFIGLLKRISDVTGRSLSSSQVNLYTVEIMRDIALKYAWLRVGELRYALEEGAKGSYGVVYDISYTSLLSWISSYRDSDERRNLVMEMTMRKAIERTPGGAPISPEELERSRMEHLREMALIAWDIFNTKLGGTIYHPDSLLFMLLPEEAYFYLEKTGKIKMTPDEKKMILEMVTKNAIMYRKQDEKAGHISQSLFQVTEDRSLDFYRSCARKYCVARYFNFLILTKTIFIP